MRPDDWHLTEDVDDFLARAGDFLRSRPGLHVMSLTWAERVRTRGAAAFGAEAPVFGVLERAGEVHATFHRLPPRALCPTPLTPEQADTLAARLAALGHSLPSVSAPHSTATAFAEAWQRHTGATPKLRDTRLCLYGLGTLTPPEPPPAGRGRLLGEQDHEQVMFWCGEFARAVGEDVTIDADSWAGTRYADKRYTLWETPDGTPVSVAGMNPLIGGQIQVDVVYTPAHLRGRGYAGAVTAEVSRAALAAGAREVVLFADLANPTSNALYQRLGYRPLTDWATYDFS
ncbi:GNAT family N-acetyltransferase [Streptomyces ipomoeae]|uniref:Acetyltransferase, GNAT family n=4 Tax=Streptomyces ipomoeae TaxID=103232 RepID=L1L1H6_9ACTN|nr:GNAT family N-acetyltransferase [Streptomyces ipomoeae]EKX66649.1 acetyltransferase, GNAT family [Streptomyces ipomoeae 91-03]MDX2695473.1 GNAT family N-acetyltransferase [Streptomyces ipomoeae]MDX2842839.1 GNAT family N-acetyltransferase [Streptomyces ipomoeae]TQE16016.1 GNAT family N-acetyltransferase [Streptomyces ipomoeae]TQE40514.1 GNAT family N-acetyltransferase [Streptomyces ipomoeae]